MFGDAGTDGGNGNRSGHCHPLDDADDGYGAHNATSDDLANAGDAEGPDAFYFNYRWYNNGNVHNTDVDACDARCRGLR